MKSIEQQLRQLESKDNLRILRSVTNRGRYVAYDGREYLNMSSNDYLGLSSDVNLQREFLESLASRADFMMSNSASRLMSGNSTHYQEVEKILSRIYGGKSALVLSSGYAVNTGILPAILSKDDVVLADKSVHASIIDGLRLCECQWKRYRHNDMEHLESWIKKARENRSCGDIWVVTESIFSMDGDRAPIAHLIDLKRKYNLKLYIDEAHAFGLFGENGGGLSSELGVEAEVDIIVGTLGKAIASTGGFVATSRSIYELLVNRMRPLIFSTALPPINLMWTTFILDRLAVFEGRREHLRELISCFNRSDSTHIIPIMAYDNTSAIAMAEYFREGGYWVTPIRFPTVPRGQSRIRISLSAAMKVAEIDKFMELCRAIG